ncbi:DUF1624 domain-containing protein [Pedobacter sp. HMF7647]|uniref:DUF1624 domain-containing protein n=1 Tax=Hufsiella arboris TaxID=2695275 RepID=A0A7K1Y6P2_9SPHI|nr:heparan-alpha-glucosaminide N-acetyltransferase domain-containing protein [Hufsiella arboris]MXV50244.1 DUF1624 domain-containing protein [Hufsiella arboris]
MEPITKRINSVDILRGAVMIIMALDHVREFFHVTAMTQDPLNLQTSTPLLFFTRWITHFCAPIFVFLSGLSAGLVSKKKTRQDTARFLVKRGLWLIAVELVVITFGLTFNPLYNILIFQVIWAIGLSMIILSLLLRISTKLILPFGLLLIFGHDLLNFLTTPSEGIGDALLKIFFTAKGYFVPLTATRGLLFLYAVLPWTGIMLVGFSLSDWYSTLDFEKRRRYLLYTGSAVLLLFIIIRGINQYGDPSPWSIQKDSLRTVLSFVNVSKYPPSLDYTTLTIGTALIILSLTEGVKSRFGNFLSVYGKVPFFYYVPHFFIIHGLVVIFFFLNGYAAKDIVPKNNPFLFRPDEFGFNIWIVYLIWMGVVLILYKPCVWFAGYKQKNSEKWWIRYL